MVLPATTAVSTTTEIGIATDNMTEAVATDFTPRPHHGEGEGRTETEIVKATDRQAMTVEAEARAEILAKSNQGD